MSDFRLKSFVKQNSKTKEAKDVKIIFANLPGFVRWRVMYFDQEVATGTAPTKSKAYEDARVGKEAYIAANARRSALAKPQPKRMFKFA